MKIRDRGFETFKSTSREVLTTTVAATSGYHAVSVAKEALDTYRARRQSPPSYEEAIKTAAPPCYVRFSDPSYKYADFYVESWEGQEVVNDLTLAISKGLINPKSVIDISFGDFTFSDDGTGKILIGGLQFSYDPKLAMQMLNQVVDLVHSAKGKVKMSFGGQTYPLDTHMKTQADADSIIANIAKVVSQNNLDGIDLDIEGGELKTLDPTLFEYFFQNLREALGDDKIISLTMPGQCWTPNPINLIKKAAPFVNKVAFMEYYLWAGQDQTTFDRIKDDLDNFYLNQDTSNPQAFCLTADKVQIGLMPGTTGAYTLSAPEAGQISAYCQSKGISLMMWDLDLDERNEELAVAQAIIGSIG